MAHVLVTATSTCRMQMHLDMACVYHQPFKVRFIHKRFERYLPMVFVPSTAKSVVGVFPVAKIRREIPPGVHLTAKSKIQRC